MLRRIFNISLAIIFIILVALFAYKTASKPQVLNVPTNDASMQVINSATGMSREALDAAIKEYIMNHPEDVIAALEEMQKRKVTESNKKAEEYLQENRQDIEEAGSPPILGSKDGDVSIVVFYDYNCSYCKRANEYTTELLEADPKVKIILRPMPILGESSIYAAKVALALSKISPESFMMIHNEMMLMPEISEETVQEMVKKYNIDHKLLENEINSYSVKKIVDKNFDIAKNLGIQGAPTYVINGHLVQGVIPTDKFKSLIAHLRGNSPKEEEKKEGE